MESMNGLRPFRGYSVTASASIRAPRSPLACSSTGASAVTVMECIDESGQKSFREFCPPGSLKKGEKKLQSKLAPGADVAAIAARMRSGHLSA
jgi:hypothetical protein